MCWWCVDDVLMLMCWWCVDDVLVMCWWCVDDVLMRCWWCVDDVLMMCWWCVDVLMCWWYCVDDCVDVLLLVSMCWGVELLMIGVLEIEIASVSNSTPQWQHYCLKFIIFSKLTSRSYQYRSFNVSTQQRIMPFVGRSVSMASTLWRAHSQRISMDKPVDSSYALKYSLVDINSWTSQFRHANMLRS